MQIQRTQHSVLTGTEARILEGALQFKEKLVEDVMTTLDKVFMLNVDDRFSFDLLFQVFKRGHSRIPVYEGNRENIVGLIFSKDLILINPEEEVPIRTVMQCHERVIHAVYNDSTLEVVFNNFKTWRQHLALVQVRYNLYFYSTNLSSLYVILPLKFIYLFILFFLGGFVLQKVDQESEGDPLPKVVGK